MYSIVTKTCEHCGREYSFRRDGQRTASARKYCSHACYAKARSKHVDWTCEVCGIVFSKPLNHGKSPRFCSRKCTNIGNTKQQVYTPENFWDYVDKSGGDDSCWPWTGTKHNGDGYGHLWYESQNWIAHRLAYVLATGPIPDGLYVCHKCANRPCCNPSHLYCGTPAQNSQDMVDHGHSLKGEKNHKAKVTAADVREIRRRWQMRESSQLDLAREYGLTPAVISKMVRRDTWKHVR